VSPLKCGPTHRQGTTQSAPMSLKPLKWYKKLATKKGRLEAEAFLVEGPRAISHVMHQHAEAILEVLTTEESPPLYHRYPVRRVTESQLGSICHTKTPQGIAAVVRLPVHAYANDLPSPVGAKVLLLEDVQDPGNVGALIRTAAAFDFSGVLLTDKCADPFSPKCVQSTAGTVLAVWISRTPGYLELLGSLKQRGYACVAADLQGTEEPSMLGVQHKLVLALGNETSGLSSSLLHLADARLKIPLSPKAESLNVAACGAICMFLSCGHKTRSRHDPESSQSH
jgi:TrmH family RNA methyltransferase